VSVSPGSGEAQDFFTASGYNPVIYTVTGADASEAIWTVTVKWQALAPEGIGDYLNALPANADGGIPGGPVFLPVSFDFSEGGWPTLLSAISGASAVSAVALDLSACTGVTEFDPDYTNSTGKAKIVSLVLPDAATSIKAGTSSIDTTFKGFTALKSVMGKAVTGVGDWAFYGCNTLETVNFPAAITIGNSAFYNCNALETVILPAAATIGGGAFRYCYTLETVSLPAATRIDAGAFEGCSALTTINLPASLTSISGSTFRGCANLTNIIIAADNANYKVEGEKLLSKDGATLIAWPAAKNDITLDSITTIGEAAFIGCTGLTSVSLPAAVTIGYMAFTRCTSLTEVDLPEVVTIMYFAFTGCTGLTEVTLPEVVTIMEFAFSGCTGLEMVNLPKATSIGRQAFSETGMTKALTVTLSTVTPPTLGTDMFLAVPNTGIGESGTKSVTVTVPDNPAWSAIIGAYNGTSTANDTWGNAFRGGGWDGESYLTGEVNENISLTIEVLP
jgi:hypothetical protein